MQLYRFNELKWHIQIWKLTIVVKSDVDFNEKADGPYHNVGYLKGEYLLYKKMFSMMFSFLRGKACVYFSLLIKMTGYHLSLNLSFQNWPWTQCKWPVCTSRWSGSHRNRRCGEAQSRDRPSLDSVNLAKLHIFINIKLFVLYSYIY